MGEFQGRLADAQGFVDFVAARQDSLNRILFERVDRKFPYTPLFPGQGPRASNEAGF